jgi:hypothetical protein
MITEAVREYTFNECNSSKNAFGPAFFEQHLSVVVEYEKRLGGTVGADLEIIDLAAWLHDLSAVQDFAALPKHPILSAEIARRVLQENHYPPERIERVPKCIVSHSSPIQLGGGTVEEVCLSNLCPIIQRCVMRVGKQHSASYAGQSDYGSVKGENIMKCRILACAFLVLEVVAVSGCRPTQGCRPDDLVRKFGATTLVNDATWTLRRSVSPDKEAPTEIPKIWWVGSIQKLRPVRVYNHRFNLVVVLESSEHTEKGLYIGAVQSSYVPMNGDDGFTFERIDGGTYAFERKI